MKKNDIVKDWLKRAKSNLTIASKYKSGKNILYEDLCFECQQSVEKSLKALLVFYDSEIIITHSISLLVSKLEEKGIAIPEFVKDSVILSDYAVQTRYPGNYEPVTKEEFNQALNITGKVFIWSYNIISATDK
jgi:HEPN domain-containing protein